MKTDEALSFIFSKAEWKEHFIMCHNKLEATRYCCCCNPSNRSFDNIKRIATCLLCNKEVKGWYKNYKKSEGVSIESVIRGEEEKFLYLIREKEPLLLSLKDNLTGETLSWLHQTHGVDPDMVEDILQIKLSADQKIDYRKYYDIHRRTGLAGFKPTIVMAESEA